MFQNAQRYNEENSVIYTDASRLWRLSNIWLPGMDIEALPLVTHATNVDHVNNLHPPTQQNDDDTPPQPTQAKQPGRTKRKSAENLFVRIF